MPPPRGTAAVRTRPEGSDGWPSALFPLTLPARIAIGSRIPLPWAMFGVAAVLRLGSFLLIYLLALATGHPGHFDMFDPVYYDRWSWYIGDHLRHGQLVDIRPYNLAGTYDVGFEYLVGLQYAIAGHHSEVPRISNALLSAGCAPLVYLAGRRTVLGEQTARTAGWLMALWPLSLYWAGYDLIKDPVAWFLVALAAYALTATGRLQYVIIGGAATVGLLLVRSYVGIGMFVLVPATALLRRDWRGFLAISGFLVLAEAALIGAGQPPVYSFLPYTGNGLPFATQDHRIAQGSVASIVGSATGDASGEGLQKAEGGSDAASVIHQSPARLLERTVVGTAITVLGPRPALKDLLHPTLDTGMYPGIVVWILLIPFTAIGLIRAVQRRNPVELSLAILAVGLLLGLSFFYGGVFRQREMIWPSMLLFTASGLQPPWPATWKRTYLAFIAVGLLALALRELATLM